MCKFQKPQVANNATDDERRAAYFNALVSLDMNDKVEKIQNLSYLSWANAWAEFKRAYPSATYRVVKNQTTGLPYFADPFVGIMVYTEVTADGITHEMWLPVMNGANKAMKFESYTYQVYDKFNKKYVEKTVERATMFDINKTIMRCLVKNLAMFGLGLYIYAGEDLPEQNNVTNEPEGNNDNTPSEPTPKKTTGRRRTTEKYAGIKTALSVCDNQNALLVLYQQHKNEVDSNVEIKNLFTQRKIELQQKAA